MFVETQGLLRENERYILAVAHALETHKTFSGEDVTAIFEGTRGPLVDGTVYADEAFIDRLREYHLAAKLAHQKHSESGLPLPSPVPAYVVTVPESYLNGNGSHAPLSAPTYDPPGLGQGPDEPNDQH
jgi:cell division protease FtsH